MLKVLLTVRTVVQKDKEPMEQINVLKKQMLLLLLLRHV